MELSKDVLRLFPPSAGAVIQTEAFKLGDAIEEIRCRVGKPYVLLSSRGEHTVPSQTGHAADLDYILERASNFSYHTVASELSSGFVHTTGGCRVGVCGMVCAAGVNQISSLSVRVPHEIVGCADALKAELLRNGIQNTLIVSPPGAGKTTLLRDVIRVYSCSGYRVSVADERGEIAAVFQREPQFDLGPRTDIMSGGKKREACMMLLRAMNPQVLAFDEITSEDDIDAAVYAFGCGVSLLATAHAESAEALHRRRLYRMLLDEHIFQRIIEISVASGKRRYEVVNLR